MLQGSILPKILLKFFERLFVHFWETLRCNICELYGQKRKNFQYIVAKLFSFICWSLAHCIWKRIHHSVLPTKVHPTLLVDTTMANFYTTSLWCVPNKQHQSAAIKSAFRSIKVVGRMLIKLTQDLIPDVLGWITVQKAGLNLELLPNSFSKRRYNFQTQYLS